MSNEELDKKIDELDDKIEEVLHLLELLYERTNDSGVGDGKFNQDLWDTEIII